MGDLTKEEGAAMFAAIEKHLPHIAADVRLKHEPRRWGSDADVADMFARIFGNKRGKR